MFSNKLSHELAASLPPAGAGRGGRGERRRAWTRPPSSGSRRRPRRLPRRVHGRGRPRVPRGRGDHGDRVRADAVHPRAPAARDRAHGGAAAGVRRAGGHRLRARGRARAQRARRARGRDRLPRARHGPRRPRHHARPAAGCSPARPATGRSTWRSWRPTTTSISTGCGPRAATSTRAELLTGGPDDTTGLTPAGARAVDALADARCAALEDLVADWSPAEHPELARYVERCRTTSCAGAAGPDAAQGRPAVASRLTPGRTRPAGVVYGVSAARARSRTRRGVGAQRGEDAAPSGPASARPGPPLVEGAARAAAPRARSTATSARPGAREQAHERVGVGERERPGHAGRRDRRADVRGDGVEHEAEPGVALARGPHRDRGAAAGAQDAARSPRRPAAGSGTNMSPSRQSTTS